ncbi:acyl-CoA dehydrogenase family protein [Tsukamurella sp. 8F]|uniref:acyl-CoA dehydrogenase family protein n=1 Tax=unclassified Tsukamurella TaxID=2633480 RepID=UPI0023BA1393|nr:MULTISPECIES: acyl-CoA dehydrogenase family protein [unclassified Tsukamurella]MDF0529299.1 acyl-CoA dehydrogenase family protein [Tsukamurella sp. 8J]MDF0586864.1 acyl-CoA dehydrogenase family protein [Tsukamurella sp. 8F]
MTTSLERTTAGASLTERFRPVFEEIAAGAVARERDRELPFDAVALLRDAGFTSLRVPTELGGSGVTLREFFGVLVDLAAADSNLPQALRVHFSFVEDQRLARSDDGDAWLRAVVGGLIAGNAITEPGVGAVDRYRTVLVPDPDGGYVLNGTKFYSTGTLYAGIIVVAADLDGERVTVLVDSEADGVQRVDDWDGFGQRLTASGTTTFTDVRIPADRVVGPGYGSPGPTYATSFLQLVQLAGLAGIAQRATDDISDWVRARTRSYTHAVADLPREDPLVQQVIGRLSAAAFTARAAVLAVADVLDDVLADRVEHTELLSAAELSAAQAQITVIDLVLEATSRLFDVGGASVVSADLRLDRHWRNARTLAVHNPVVYKSRAIGDYLLNGTELPYAWSAGRRPGNRP